MKVKINGYKNKISIHALREEGDGGAKARHQVGTVISIHALREEGDHQLIPVVREFMQFLSTPSARRATPRCSWTPGRTTHFYPRPPRGGRRCQPESGRYPAGNFYPRPPRGGRRIITAHRPSLPKFLSTPSARRATDRLREGA